MLNKVYKKNILQVYKYDVYFVDYGNVEGVEVRNIRPLPQLYQGLPCQAIPCKVSEIAARPIRNDMGGEDEDDDLDEDDDDYFNSKFLDTEY